MFLSLSLSSTKVLEDCPGNLDFWYRHISKGAWPFSTADHGWPISDCTAEGLKVIIHNFQFTSFSYFFCGAWYRTFWLLRLLFSYQNFHQMLLVNQYRLSDYMMLSMSFSRYRWVVSGCFCSIACCLVLLMSMSICLKICICNWFVVFCFFE